MKRLTAILLLLSLTGCYHSRASWRVYVPFATTRMKDAKKAGIQGCIKGAIPAVLCNH